MNLPNIIRPEHTFIGVSAPTKWRALQTISEKAAKAFSVDGQTILKSLEAREKLGSTGIGNGIAIPHAAIDGMTSPRGLLVRFAQPLDFEAIDDIPAEMTCAPGNQCQRHARLHRGARFSRLLLTASP